jgi:hypothetical protein
MIRSIFVVLAVFLTPFIALSQPEWLSDGLVAYYPFDGNGNDISGNENNGNIAGAAEFISVAREIGRGGAIRITGDNGVFDIPDFDTSQITVSLWFVPSNVSAGSWNTLIGKDGFWGYNHLVYDSSGTIGTIKDTEAIMSGSHMENGELYHLVYAKADKHTSIYLNGKLILENFSDHSNESYPVSRIGNYDANLEQGADGTIDEVRIYQRKLSAGEVSELYDSEFQHRNATAVAVISNGLLVNSVLLDGGYGYSVQPTVKVVDTTGSGASLAPIVSNGRLIGLTVLSPGSNYSQEAEIVVGPPPVSSRSAYAEANIVNGFLVGIELLDGGEGYKEAPTIDIVGGVGSGAIVEPVLQGGRIVSFVIRNAGLGYSENTVVRISPPAERPRISIRVASVEVNLSLNVGSTYLLEHSKDMVEWSARRRPFVATREFMSFTFNVDEYGKFYRVIEQP